MTIVADENKAVYEFIERPGKGEQEGGTKEESKANEKESTPDKEELSLEGDDNSDLPDSESNADDGASKDDGDGDASSDKDADSTFKVGEATYTGEELQEALKDSSEKKEWQRKQTQRDQKLSEQFQVIEGFSDIARHLQDKEVAGQVRDILTDKWGDEIGETFDKLLKFDGEELSAKQAETSLGRLRKEHDETREEVAVMADRQKFAEKHNLTPKQVARVEKYADDAFEKSNGEVVLSLEAARREILLERREKALERKEKENGAPKIPNQPAKDGGTRQAGGEKKKYDFFV